MYCTVSKFLFMLKENLTSCNTNLIILIKKSLWNHKLSYTLTALALKWLFCPLNEPKNSMVRNCYFCGILAIPYGSAYVSTLKSESIISLLLVNQYKMDCTMFIFTFTSLTEFLQDFIFNIKLSQSTQCKLYGNFPFKERGTIHNQKYNCLCPFFKHTLNQLTFSITCSC